MSGPFPLCFSVYSLILAYISSFVVSLGCGLYEVLDSVTFFPWPVSISSLSAWFVMYFVFTLCIFDPTFRLFEFRMLNVEKLNAFQFVKKRATSLTNLKFVRSSPSTLTPLEMYAFLKMPSIMKVTRLGENGSPCLAPHINGNSSDTNLSKWFLAVALL